MVATWTPNSSVPANGDNTLGEICLGVFISFGLKHFDQFLVVIV